MSAADPMPVPYSASEVLAPPAPKPAQECEPDVPAVPARGDGEMGDEDQYTSVPTHYSHPHEWGENEPTVPFFPHHFLSEVTAMFLVLSLFTALCILFPASLDIKADPMATPTGSKPEWYFLFLYAYLHFVPPVVGTFTPMVGVVLLTLLPFLDRNPDRAPRKRIVAIVGSLALLAVIVALSILGVME